MTAKKRSEKDLSAQLERLGYESGKNRPKISRDDIRRAVRGRRSAPRPSSPTVTSAEPIVYRRDLPRQTPNPVSRRRRNGPPVVLEKSADGKVLEHARGRAFTVTTRAAEIPLLEPVSNRFNELMARTTSGLYTHVDTLCNPVRITPEDVIFMDVESTGLRNSPLFLIGIMVWNGNAFEIQQFFARNYAEEAAVIALFLEACESRKLLITFNGKSFDFPYIRARAATNSIPFTIDPYHLDMLHACRRIWKKKLPDCKLQTLETFICKRPRHGDIPGCEIPDAYHEYVHSSDAWQMVDVLKHNLLDLLTLADLMNHFPDTVVEQKGAKSDNTTGASSR